MNKEIQIGKHIERILTQKLDYYAPQTDPPLVSIISSFYNSHLYFDETYHSIFNQTMQNFEWIIVDDCSTNKESINFFNNLESRSEKIKTFRHEENKGPSAGRNTAIAQARGKYLFFIDCDDLIDPTYLEKCVLFLELYPEYSFVNSYTEYFSRKDFQSFESIKIENKDLDSQSLIINGMTIRLSDLYLIREKPTKDIYQEKNLELLFSKQKGQIISELLFYRCHPNEQKFPSLARNAGEISYSKLSYLESPDSYELKKFKPNLRIDNKSTKTDSKHKILFLFPHLRMGGADRFNLNLLNFLKTYNYQITIATTDNTEHSWHSNYQEITMDIFHLGNYAHEIYWLPFLKYLIQSRQIEIVFISNSYFAYYLAPLLRIEFPYLTFIDFTHMHDKGWRGDGYPRLSRQFSDYLDLQIVSSNYLANYNLKQKPNAKKKWEVIYTGIDIDQWKHNKSARKEIRHELKIEDTEVLLIFPARLSVEKRPLFLVEIINKLIKQSLPVRVLVIGDGYLLESIKRRVEVLKLEEVFIFIPTVKPELMPNYYSAADILILPSEYEGISLSVYEAMAMNLPVVTSDVGGQSELVTKETGYLICKGNGDEHELQDYEQVLIPLITSKELRKKLGNNARKRIEDFFTELKTFRQLENDISKATSEKNMPSKLVFQDNETDLAEEVLILASECARLNHFFDEDFKKLIEGKKWLEKQYEEWKSIAKTSESQYKLLKNQVEQLIEGKAWLESQYNNWKKIAEDRENQIVELKEYIEQLIEAKNWLENLLNIQKQNSK